MSNADRAVIIREMLAAVSSSVRLVYVEEPLGCESCPPTRQLLEQLASLSPHVTVEVMNLVQDRSLAAQHGVDRVPAIVVSSPGRDRIRFYGAPVGHELMSLLEAIRMTASGESGVSDESRTLLATLKEPVHVQVFFTPSCVYCPQMVTLANRLAVESPLMSATAIDATEYPDLVRRYSVNGVPKTVLNDTLEIIGAANEAEVVKTVLSVAGLR